MFEKEYETLRHELNENKKYVFERPLLIITAALVLFQYISKSPFIMLLPVIVYSGHIDPPFRLIDPLAGGIIPEGQPKNGIQ